VANGELAKRLCPGYTASHTRPLSGGTGLGGPNDIARDNDGVFYICEQEANGEPPFVSIRDDNGTVLARWTIRHAHGLWVDTHGDIYLGLTTSHSVDKYVRVN